MRSTALLKLYAASRRASGKEEEVARKGVKIIGIIFKGRTTRRRHRMIPAKTGSWEGLTQRRGILRSLGKPLCRPHWIHYHCPRQSLLFLSARNSRNPHPPPPVIFGPIS